MRRASPNPTPDRIENTELTWALVPLVRRGTVAGATGRFPPMGAMVVVVVVGGIVVVGARYVAAGRVTAGTAGTARVTGVLATVVGVTVARVVAVVGAGAVVVGVVAGEVGGGVVTATVGGGWTVDGGPPKTMVVALGDEARAGGA